MHRCLTLPASTDSTPKVISYRFGDVIGVSASITGYCRWRKPSQHWIITHRSASLENGYRFGSSIATSLIYDSSVGNVRLSYPTLSASFSTLIVWWKAVASSPQCTTERRVERSLMRAVSWKHPLVKWNSIFTTSSVGGNYSSSSSLISRQRDSPNR